MARLAIHPGEHLAEELTALDVNAAELARRVALKAASVQSSGRVLHHAGPQALRLTDHSIIRSALTRTDLGNVMPMALAAF